ncbi:protein tweety homolog 2-like [Carassius auratus]|uniref:Protein tweety homolog n=1 Tax=Carassius auratus TaxID=7957 RepID=A0A6P6NSV2_CARAU|nr:protein tweety homolog 2-like [Carassius auratus]
MSSDFSSVLEAEGESWANGSRNAAGLREFYSAVGVGFYGNSETNDGVYQLTYSISNANHTLGSIGSLVGNSLGSMQVGLKEHLERLDEIFSPRGDYTQTLRFMQQMANNIIQQMTAMPDTGKVQVDLAAIADKTSFIEYYRWLTYLLLLILDLVICLIACLGLAKQSRWMLTVIMVCGVLTLIMSWASLGAGTATAVGTSDFCVSPDKFIVNQTKDSLSADIVHYYLYCSQSLPNPFQQSLTIFQRSLTTMQIQVQGLLQFSVAVFPTAEKDLLGIQRILNSSEFSLHQLTALLDCRSLHKDYLEALLGVCYDGVEGLLYLCLFSLLAACAFCALLCAVPRAWTLITIRDRDYDDIDEEDPFNPSRRITPYNPSRAQVHSFCSYSSSMGSQTSLHPPLPATSSTPEYMNQSMLFERSPRYENVPLIGSGSPPPSLYPQTFRNIFAQHEDHLPVYD